MSARVGERRRPGPGTRRRRVEPAASSEGSGMFLGEFQHSLDAKGRVILPVEFRDELAEGAVITRGLDGCLSVFPREEFEAMAESVREKSRRGDRERRAARTFFAS